MTGDYQRKDHYYHKAKAEGARSRAFYKIQELDRKYRLLKAGDFVLDLGAWPGGWLQYIEQRVGPNGLGVGIDLTAIEDFSSSHIKVLTADVRDESCLTQALALSAGRLFDVVLSDLGAKLTGIREVDHAAAAGLAEAALWTAGRVLRPGGNLAVKVFMSGEAQQFVRQVRSIFNECKREEPRSSRKTSTEFYVVALGFKGVAPTSVSA